MAATHDFSTLRPRLLTAADFHDRRVGLNGLLYNYGTVFVITVSSLAALVPNIFVAWDGAPVMASVLSGLAAIWVAVERSLSFGERWTFNKELASRYRLILDRLDFLEVYPQPERDQEVRAIMGELVAIRRQEASIPGAATRNV